MCTGAKGPVFGLAEPDPFDDEPTLPEPEDAGPPGPTLGDAAVGEVGPTPVDPGLIPLEPPLNASAKFDWKETVPGKGQCRPGNYSGTFYCSVMGAQVNPLFERVEGTVQFTVEPGETAKLKIMNGLALSLLFYAPLEGTLDCNADAKQLNAVSMGMPVIEVPMLLVPFEATLVGDLDREKGTIQGVFSSEDKNHRICNGMFAVAATTL